ncbi:MAG: hypothetical protein JOZ54_25735, partial [Acidobacteria bacterium]|nr:hypothetical protein [Acidobacteriota bacterium]
MKEMRDGDRLTFCMLRNGNLQFMLNQRFGIVEPPADYDGIRLYWAPSDLHA